jgi:hypothetical protein
VLGESDDSGTALWPRGQFQILQESVNPGCSDPAVWRLRRSQYLADELMAPDAGRAISTVAIAVVETSQQQSDPAYKRSKPDYFGCAARRLISERNNEEKSHASTRDS